MLRGDLITYTKAIALLIIFGVIGMVHHIGENLTSQGLVIQERFVSGAPFLAHMLFANLGAIGLIALLDPK